MIKDLDKAIDDLVVVLPEYQCLTSIPGIGPVYAAGILAEIGQIERFSDETKLAKQNMLGFIGDRINLVNLNLKIHLWLNEVIAISAII